MDQIPDSQIPTVRAPNPILDAIAEKRLAKAKELFLPGAPICVVKRAQEAATSTGVTLLLLVGLMVKLNRLRTVTLKPALIHQAGLSQYQVKRAALALSKVDIIRIVAGPGKRREITLIDEEYLSWLQDPRH